MGERKILSVILLTSLTFLLMAKLTFSCNQMLCASIVSKCMLTQSCKCEMKNCTCCHDCYQCLSWLWQECCSCVGEFAFLRTDNCAISNLRNFSKIYVPNQATQRTRCQSNRITRSSKAFQDYSTHSLKIQTTTSGPSSHSQSITTHHFTDRIQKIHNFICVSWAKRFQRFHLNLSLPESSDIDLQSVKDLQTVTVNCSVTYMSPCMSMIKW